MSEEQATVDFVELDIDDYAAKATVTEAALHQLYDENKARYTQPGRRHARPSSSRRAATTRPPKRRHSAPTNARRRARTLRPSRASCRTTRAPRTRAETSAKAERADFVGPFGDAVWSMQPGEIRGPVKTEFGWHVIKLESAAPESVRPFEDVRAELENELRHSQVGKSLRRRTGRTRHRGLRGLGRHRGGRLQGGTAGQAGRALHARGQR